MLSTKTMPNCRVAARRFGQRTLISSTAMSQQLHQSVALCNVDADKNTSLTQPTILPPTQSTAKDVSLVFARSEGVGDLDAIYLCAVEAGWAYSKSEWERILSTASETQVCWTTDVGTGSPVVCGVGVCTSVEEDVGQKLGLIGMMISHPTYRRRGIANEFSLS